MSSLQTKKEYEVDTDDEHEVYPIKEEEVEDVKAESTDDEISVGNIGSSVAIPTGSDSTAVTQKGKLNLWQLLSISSFLHVLIYCLSFFFVFFSI